MPLKRSRRLSIEIIERDFFDALHRLKKGEPRNKKLRREANDGVLKISHSNVAVEAGHSRTLIALKEGCRLPSVREAVDREISGKRQEPNSLNDVIDALRAKLKQTQSELSNAKAQIVEHFLNCKNAETEVAKWKAEAERLRTEMRSGKVVFGVVPVSTPATRP